MFLIKVQLYMMALGKLLNCCFFQSQIKSNVFQIENFLFQFLNRCIFQDTESILRILLFIVKQLLKSLGFVADIIQSFENFLNMFFLGIIYWKYPIDKTKPWSYHFSWLKIGYTGNNKLKHLFIIKIERRKRMKNRSCVTFSFIFFVHLTKESISKMTETLSRNIKYNLNLIG